MTSPDPAFLQEAALQTVIGAMAPNGVRVACRAIRDGDESHLLPAEARSMSTRIDHRRRASGAARFAARRLFEGFSVENDDILRGSAGEPVWPAGIVGSLAHDEVMAVAAVARSASVRSVGIDVEPAEPLPAEVAALVMTEADDIGSLDPALAGRLLFSAKEAVYKAAYSLERQILDYEDIAIELGKGRARIRSGLQFRLVYCIAPRIVTLAVAVSD